MSKARTRKPPATPPAIAAIGGLDLVAVTDGRGVGVADTGVAVADAGVEVADAGVEVADAVVEAGAPARPVGGAVRKSAVERHEGLG